MKITALCVALILLLTEGVWAGTEKVLYAFCSQQNCADGAYPYAGVISDKAHNLYGTTQQGGDNFAGLVYELKHTKSGWKESVLYKFTGGADGAAPTGQLVFDTKGNLYGIANGGGAGYGTVYELTPSKGSWTFKVIYTFQGGTDGNPGIGVSGISRGWLVSQVRSGSPPSIVRLPGSGSFSLSVIPGMYSITRKSTPCCVSKS